MPSASQACERFPDGTDLSVPFAGNRRLRPSDQFASRIFLHLVPVGGASRSTSRPSFPAACRQMSLRCATQLWLSMEPAFFGMPLGYAWRREDERE